MSTVTHIYTQFDYTNKIFSTEASELNWAPGSYFSEINLIGKTGAVMLFNYDKTVTGPGGIVSWDYSPSTETVKKFPDSKGIRIRIFNE